MRQLFEAIWNAIVSVGSALCDGISSIVRENPRFTAVVVAAGAFYWALGNVPGFTDAAAQIVVLVVIILILLPKKKGKK